MICLFCDKTIDISWDTAHIPFYNKLCQPCHVEYNVELDKINTYRINFFHKNEPAKLVVTLWRSEAYLYLQRPDNVRSPISIPWELAQKITIKNIQDKIRTFLTFS